MIALKPGEDLQRLVRLIEIGVANNPNVGVESPARLPDKDTGRSREHDVLVTIRQHHHLVRVALECRDRSRKVGVPEVEAFAHKCGRTGVDKGVIVSTKGFTVSAKKKAAAHNVGCFTLEPASQFDWMGTNVFHHVERRLRSVSVRFELADGAKPDITSTKFYFGDGQELTRDRYFGLASSGLDQLTEAILPREADPEVTYSSVFDLTVDGPEGPPFAVDEGGVRHEISGGKMGVTFQVAVTEIPFLFHSYADLLEEVGITQAATTSFAFEDRSAHVVAVSNDDGTKTIKVVVDKA